MSAQESRHIRAHTWEHTYESKHMRADIWEHTDDSAHMRANRGEHTGVKAHRAEQTYESTHMKAHTHIWQHTYESTHIWKHRYWAHIWEHREKHTYQSTAESTHLSLRSREAEGQVTRAILCGNLQEKCQTPSPKESFCVEMYKKSAGPGFRGPHFIWKSTGKNARGNVTRAIFCGNLNEKCRTLFPGSTFCMEKNTGKNAHGDV